MGLQRWLKGPSIDFVCGNPSFHSQPPIVWVPLGLLPNSLRGGWEMYSSCILCGSWGCFLFFSIFNQSSLISLTDIHPSPIGTSLYLSPTSPSLQCFVPMFSPMFLFPAFPPNSSLRLLESEHSLPLPGSGLKYWDSLVLNPRGWHGLRLSAHYLASRCWESEVCSLWLSPGPCYLYLSHLCTSPLLGGPF